MTPTKRFTGKLALVAAAILGAPLLTAAPQASAGDVDFSIRIGNSHGHSGHYEHSPRHHRSHGYYKQVWNPPIYRNRYDDCGRAIRICVRPGYYSKIWVSTRHYRSTYDRRDHYRSSDRHYSSKRHDRPSSTWGNRSNRRSCR